MRHFFIAKDLSFAANDLSPKESNVHLRLGRRSKFRFNDFQDKSHARPTVLQKLFETFLHTQPSGR